MAENTVLGVGQTGIIASGSAMYQLGDPGHYLDFLMALHL